MPVMETRKNGAWVRHSAYAALSAQLEVANDGWKESVDLTRLARQQYSDAKYQLETAKTELARISRDNEFEAWAGRCQRERDDANTRAETAHATGKAEGLRAAADFCKYKSAEWDHASKTHRLMEWSLSIGCHHVGHAYEAGILALISADTPAAKVTVLGKDHPAIDAYWGASRDTVTTRDINGWRKSVCNGLNAALRAIAGGKP
jgi:hypothetical protein